MNIQRWAATDDLKQNIYIGMRTGTVFGVLRVFGENQQTVLGRLGVNRSKARLQVAVDAQRSLLAGLVLDGRHDGPLGVSQVDPLKIIDGWELLQIVFELGGRLDHQNIAFTLQSLVINRLAAVTQSLPLLWPPRAPHSKFDWTGRAPLG